MQKLQELFPANRIAAIIGLLTAIAGAMATLQTSFAPGSPGSEAIAKAIALLGSAALALGVIYKFLDGSQKSEALQTKLAIAEQQNSTVVVDSTATV